MASGDQKKVKLDLLNIYYQNTQELAPKLLGDLFKLFMHLTASEFGLVIDSFGILIEHSTRRQLARFDPKHLAGRSPETLFALARAAYKTDSFFDFPSGELESAAEEIEALWGEYGTDTAQHDALDETLKRYTQYVAYLALEHEIGPRVLRELEHKPKLVHRARRSAPPSDRRPRGQLRLVR